MAAHVYYYYDYDYDYYYCTEAFLHFCGGRGGSFRGGGDGVLSTVVPLNILCLIPGPHLSKMPRLLLSPSSADEPLRVKFEMIERSVVVSDAARPSFDVWLVFFFIYIFFFNYAFDRCDTHHGDDVGVRCQQFLTGAIDAVRPFKKKKKYLLLVGDSLFKCALGTL